MKTSLKISIAILLPKQGLDVCVVALLAEDRRSVWVRLSAVKVV